MRSSSWPARPTNGLPCKSSSRPGASPLSLSLGSSLPRAKHRLVAVRFKAQPSNAATSASSSARDGASAGLAEEDLACGGRAWVTGRTGGSSGLGTTKQSSGVSPMASSTPMASYQASSAASAVCDPLICDASADLLCVSLPAKLGQLKDGLRLSILHRSEPQV